MLGWQIFIHSVRMVFSNLLEALQIGLVPSVAAAIFSTLVLGLASANGIDAGDPAMHLTAKDALNVVLAALINILVSLWIFVAWHRFVLLEEYPKGWIPSFNLDRIGAYIWCTVQLIVVCVIASVVILVPLLLVGSILAAIVPPLGYLLQLLPFAAFFVVYVLFIRLGAALPAAAIGEPLGFMDAKKATEGSNGTITIVVLILAFVQVVLSLLIFQASQILPIVGIASQTIIGLVISLVNVSVLTTVYGIYVEKRELA
ncbi:hypothetical protein [Ruegeria arenilitoris]|uniref:hypothetical protein n=1 Tax=Ruegeria arenilitoris TaxID=1173585 RepID=UPI00147BB85A|nr:hypothetical protein [Ruegeria arenilitoris]